MLRRWSRNVIEAASLVSLALSQAHTAFGCECQRVVELSRVVVAHSAVARLREVRGRPGANEFSATHRVALQTLQPA